MGGKLTWKYAIFLCLLTNCKIHGYNKSYTLYQVTAFSHVERFLVLLMEKLFKPVNILNGVTNEAALPIVVAVDDCCIEEFVSFLKQFSISFVKISNYYNDYRDLKSKKFNLDAFNDWDSMDSWFLMMEKKYPIMLTRIVIGLTYEKREILVFKVSKHQKNPSVIILGGEEGRDWMSTAIVLNLMDSVLTHNQYMLPIDYYFIPLLNPDGYEFSRTKERFWAKNRREFTPKILCPDNSLPIGANIDRNWFDGNGDLRDCSAIFEGTKPVSEEETFTLSLFLDTIAPQTMAFFNLRGFDQLITTPYATNKKIAFNYDTTFIIESLEISSYLPVLIFDSVYFLSDGNIQLCMWKFEESTQCTIHLRQYCQSLLSGNCADWIKENINVPMVATIYLKYGNEVIPEPSHISHIYQHIKFLLSDILHLTNDLYGPLFNSQNDQSFHYILHIITVAMNILI